MMVFPLILIIILSACSSGGTTQPANKNSEATARPILINTFRDLQNILQKIDKAAPAEAQSRAGDALKEI
jgi:uncharacterized lipoprotein